jgi:DNA 3'-phosphatase
MLQDMANLHKFDKMRNRAYRKASAAIRDSTNPITSGDQAKRTLTGVGASSARCIDEYIKTGKVKELENRTDSEIDIVSVTNLFQNIHGVGEKCAVKWYEAGHRTLNDLYQLYANKGMTHAQEIGYFYYRDFLLKIPRVEIDILARTISVLWSKVNGFPVTFQIAGSYRRNEKESGDIDILVQGRPGMKMADILKPLIDGGLIINHITESSGHKYMGVCRISNPGYSKEEIHARRIDIRIVEPDTWPFALLYFTGSQNLNILMRQEAINKGYTLNEYSLSKVDGGEAVICKSEIDIFTALNLVYLAPIDRHRDIKSLQFINSPKPINSASLFKYNGGSVTTMIYRSLEFGQCTKSHTIASFDLDSTLIEYSNGNVFCKDLKLMQVMKNRQIILLDLIQKGYTIVIFSNQKCKNEQDRFQKVEKLEHAIKLLDVPCVLMASHDNDQYRKPNIGMWELLGTYFTNINKDRSFFCGDAAGRPGDFAASDKGFADGNGLTFYIPEFVFKIE